MRVEEFEEESYIRPPAVAGVFYPESRKELEATVKKLLEKAPFKSYGRLRGLIVPHAGYMFSGEVAAHGFKQVDVTSVKKVIIVGPSHHEFFAGASIGNYTHHQTPLGSVKVSEEANELIKKGILALDTPHEHSVEVELPFLQVLLGSENFEILPIVTCSTNPEELAKVLIEHVDDNTLVVASSDLSHYHPYEEALKLDEKSLRAIMSWDFEAMGNECEACGKVPILTLMYIAREKGWFPKFIAYKNSGDVTGKDDAVVGYVAIGFYEGEVGEEEQKVLLKLARKTLENYLAGKGLPKLEEKRLPESLRKKRGCFVTLKKRGELRGCIGCIFPEEKLYRCVMENAVNAAVNDTRFPPVTKNELREIEIEISVLTQPEKLESKDWKGLLKKLSGREGVIVKKGFYQATYLPQVWEQIPKKEDFLSTLCMKAGLSPDCWKEKDVEVYAYRAQVFGEKDFSPSLILSRR